MTGLLDVIQERLHQEGKSLEQAFPKLGDYPRAKVDFPKTVEDFLSEKEVKSGFIEGRAKEAKKLEALTEFFILNPSINLRNFSKAKALFLDLFSDEASFKESFVLLSEELDKKTDKSHKFGKAYLSYSKPGRICIERSSYEFGYVKQYLKIDFENNDLTAYTVWVDKAKGVEILRSSNKVRKAASESSVEFDANIWKSFNTVGITKDNYLKTLDCIERNHLNLESFIEVVNEKNVFNLLHSRLMDNVSIVTNGRDTTYLDFDAGEEQRVSVKLTKAASSMLISKTEKLGNK